MPIQGPDITSKLILDLSQFINSTNLASTQMRKSTKQMEGQVGQFATTMDGQGNKISGSWWKRFGTVALGFTIAYRAMNVFENGLIKLGSTIGKAILQSGELAEQQVKNAFWMTIFADKAIDFSDAFRLAGGAITSLRNESVRSISAIDELTTGIDELAQAGLPITTKLMPQMVSLVDFTGMVAQTVGSTTRQIRQELQALMDGTSRVTNQLVRVLTNMGVLTAENLADLKNMVNRAEIFDKIVGAIHERWLAMVDTLIRSSPERAFAFWEKSIQKVVMESVKLASELKGVENIFGETLYQAAKKFRTEMDQADMNRLVNLMNTLNSALRFLTDVFNTSVTGIGKAVIMFQNLAKELDVVWDVLGDLAVFVLATKAVQALGKMMLWVAVGPAKTLAKAFTLALSPVLLLFGALSVIGVTVFGHVIKNLDELNKAWNESIEKIKSWKDTVVESIMSVYDTTVEYWGETIGKVKDALKVSGTANIGGIDISYEFFPDDAVEDLEEKLKKVAGFAKDFADEVRPTESLIKGIKDTVLSMTEEQIAAFKTGLDTLKKSIDPYAKQFVSWFDDLFVAPEAGALAESVEEVNVAFKDMLAPVTIDGLKKMENEMEKFVDETPAFVASLEALKSGLIKPEDLDDFVKSQKIMSSYNIMMADLNKQLQLAPESEKRRAEYDALVKIVDEWKNLALGHNAAQYALKRYQEQLKLLETIQDGYNSLVMTGKDYELWALDESLKKQKALAIGNTELIDLLDQYTDAKIKSIENEFNGLTELAGNIAQSMESSFSDLFFDVMTMNWEDLGDLAESTLNAMQRALSDFLAQATREALMGSQTGSGSLIGGLFSSFFNKLLGGSGEADYYSPFYEAHKGWNVGNAYAPTRMLSTSLLENAVRLHSGLRSDEYPAVLQQGERVYAKGESPIESVTIINNTDFKPQVSEKQRPSGGKDVSIIIGEMLANDIYKGGPLKNAMQVTYGLSQRTIRR